MWFMRKRSGGFQNSAHALPRKKCVVIMLDGTGSTLGSGLAVAAYLTTQNWEVRVLGAREGRERKAVVHNQFDVIDVGGTQSGGWKSSLCMPWRLLRGLYQALSVLRRSKASVVLAMGGEVSGVGGLAAWLRRIPLVLHEQNRILRSSHRWLLPFSRKILTGFSGTYSDEHVVGNPLHEDFLHISPPAQRFAERHGPLRVLVLGAHKQEAQLNRILPEAASLLGAQVEIRHEVLKNKQSQVEALYRHTCPGRGHQVTVPDPDRAAVYAWPDLVICRAGALAVTKMSVVGLGGIFIPQVHADHRQAHNACCLVERGAALKVSEDQFTAERLCELISHTTREEWARRARLAYDKQRLRPEALIHQALLGCTQTSRSVD